jgi:hypothetical protein
MKTDPIATSIIAAVMLYGACAIIAGCSSARIQSEIDRLPWRDSTPAVTPPAADIPDAPAPDLPPAPAPDPEPPPMPPAVDPAPVPDPAPAETDQFIWEPRADSVRIVIPASLPHWQLHLFSRSQHHTVYGPDKSKSREYILPGSGASWGAKAAGMDSKSGIQLIVYINTTEGQSTGHASAGWRILDPTKRVEGDTGTRLQKGENK